jgi:hypothetical protein
MPGKPASRSAIVTVVTVVVCPERRWATTGLRMFHPRSRVLRLRVGPMAEMMSSTDGRERIEHVVTPAEAEWWLRKAGSLRLRQPAAAWVSQLMDRAGDTALACPCCSRHGSASATLDHVLSDHGFSSAAAAAWLETVDGDLFSLAVHYLMSARTA